MVSVGGAAVKSAAAEFVLEAVAGPVDGEDFAVMEEPVEVAEAITSSPNRS